MRKIFVFLLVIMFVCEYSSTAFSWEGHYRFRGGHYYRDAGWWGLGGFVSGLAIGAYVASLPPRYETVVIGGAPYYYADGYYYQAGPDGYVVVAPPVEQGQAAPGENFSMAYVLGILFAILLVLCIVLISKRLLIKPGS